MVVSLKTRLVSLCCALLLALTLTGLFQFTHAPKAHADSFPPDTVWSFISSDYQAWARPLESDPSSGEHFNLVIQALGGGRDYANFHVTYQGLETVEGSSAYVWGVEDSVRGVCSSIQESVALDESTAASNAFYSLVQEVSQAVEEVGAGLLNTGVSTVTNLIESLMGDGTLFSLDAPLHRLLDLTDPLLWLHSLTPYLC